MSPQKVYLIGGRGYLGSGLYQALKRYPQLSVEVIDANVYEEGRLTKDGRGDDVRRINPASKAPGIAVWLATLHKEPDGLDELGQEKWRCLGGDLMVDAPRRWYDDGHKILYISSMQVVSGFYESLYAQLKNEAESYFVGRLDTTTVRFGTIWGNLERDPTRPQTAINAAILGHRLPDDQYRAYTTSYQEAVYQLAWEITNGLFWGEVRNFCDTAQPVEGDFVRASFEAANPRHRLQASWATFRAHLTAERIESLKSRTHPTELLASYYKLPYPKEGK
jgi:nucleoside-diphosphate-sugar epimerase